MSGGMGEMRRKGGWCEARGPEGYVLARQWPPRFDVEATAQFPRLRAARLARQIRQDLWRELQSLRGFSPVVQILFTEGGLAVTAGGRVNGQVPSDIVARIQALLDDPARRARWSVWARERTS